MSAEPAEYYGEGSPVPNNQGANKRRVSSEWQEAWCVHADCKDEKTGDDGHQASAYRSWAVRHILEHPTHEVKVMRCTTRTYTRDNIQGIHS